MSKFDVIIIGSGLGGLSCGIILSKEGKKVCVVEKAPCAGGCLRSYRRKGMVFDTGMHYVGSMDEGGILRHFFKYAGVWESLRMRRLDAEACDVVSIDGREVNFAQGYDAFVESLCDSFPREKDNIENYAKSVAEAGRVIGVEQLRKGRISAGSLKYMSLSASAMIDDFTSDIHLRRVLAGTSFLYDGIRDFTPFYHHAMIRYSFISGAYRFVDGSSQLAEALCREIRRHGGEIRCGDPVTGIGHEENRVRRVRLASGEVLETECVISDIHPSVLLPMIDAGSAIRPVYARRIGNAANSLGAFTLNLTLDSGLFPYRNRNYYLHPEGDCVWREVEGGRRSSGVVCTMQALSEERGKSGLSLMMPLSFSEVEQWADTRIGQRGEAYNEWKRQTAEKMLQVVRQHFPNLGEAVLDAHASSPLTYRDYTGTPQGTAYGMLTDCRNVMTTLLSPVTKLGGLYLTGQNIAVHGALGVVMSAIATCGAMLGEEYVAHRIGDF